MLTQLYTVWQMVRVDQSGHLNPLINEETQGAAIDRFNAAVDNNDAIADNDKRSNHMKKTVIAQANQLHAVCIEFDVFVIAEQFSNINKCNTYLSQRGDHANVLHLALVRLAHLHPNLLKNLRPANASQLPDIPGLGFGANTTWNEETNAEQQIAAVVAAAAAGGE